VKFDYSEFIHKSLIVNFLFSIDYAGKTMNDEAGEVEGLHWFYKLLLKFPVFNLDIFPSEFQGIFWIIIVPIYLVLQLFANLFLLSYFTFPINYLCILAVDLFVFIAFLRITLERALNTGRAILRSSVFHWDIEKALQEYYQILSKSKEEAN